MTLKQFGKLAAGVILALIVYAINPPDFIKWFLIFLFGGIGAAMAFVPFEGRPIDVWIIAFFKRIYSPTQYIWKQAVAKTTLSLKKPAAQIVAPVASPAPAQPIPAPEKEVLFKSPAKPVLPPKPKTPSAPRTEAKFAPEAVIPAPPTLPNLLVGFTHNKKGEIIEGAILEIRDSDGIPVRAFKTNKLGQFRSATPLPDGSYEIETEKEGFSFDIIKIELKGKILSPIEIISK